MKYVPLSKIYYTSPDMMETEYQARYNAPYTRKFDINIQQFNHKKAYPAFICYTEELMLLTEKILMSSSVLLDKIRSVPPVVLRQFAMLCIVDEVKSTNDIEGVHSTRRELEEVLSGLSTSSRFYTIVNKYASILHEEKISFSTNEDIRKFYDDFAHEEVATENPKNRLDSMLFRKNSVDVISTTGKTLHRGLMPEDRILTVMEEALSILNDNEMPLLVRVSIFHYLFAYIHPFYDGNGRTGRFIVSYFLSQNFHHLVAMRLSVVIKKRRKFYYELFKNTDSELNCGDLTPFVWGFMSLISETFQDTIRLLDKKSSQLEKYKEKLRRMDAVDSKMLNIYYILLQAALFYGRGVSIKELQDITGMARGTIQSRLNAIPQGHIVIKKEKAWYYKLNMMIFRE